MFPGGGGGGGANIQVNLVRRAIFQKIWSGVGQIVGVGKRSVTTILHKCSRM